jgi:hypothetical protein
MAERTALLPELPYAAWRETKDTLHLWAQIVGKVKLAVTVPDNHWWNIPLYVDVRGLTTRDLHRNGVMFGIDFDFVDHRLVVRTDRGETTSFALHDGLSVAEFNRRLHELLARSGVDVEILERPFGVPMKTPFTADTEHASYQPEYVEAFWHTLAWVDQVFDEFSGWFSGKSSPVHLFWHSFDLAVTRFCGRSAVVAADADPVTREAYSEELISFGFWAGDVETRAASFYSYTHPEPDGLREQRLPEPATWQELNGSALALLPYDAVRASADPRATLLEFLDTAYRAGASLRGWDMAGLRSSYCPPNAGVAG